jgi:hypothetical protein
MNDATKTIRTTRIRPNWVCTFLGLSLCMAGSLMGVLASSSTAAEPFAPAGQVDVWTLDFKPGALRLYVDPIDGKHYHYFTYQVRNRTTDDRMFAPRAELFTDKGEILRSGDGVPTEVSRRLLGLLSQPLMENENQIIGDLRQGKENARDGIVIWKATDLESNEMTIFVTGLSNAFERVKHPITQEDIILRKTLRLDYVTPGNMTDSVRVAAQPARPEETDRGNQFHAKITNGTWIWR